MRIPSYIFAVPVLVMSGFAHAEFSGVVSAELRHYSETALDARQQDEGISIFAEPEFYYEWSDGRQSLTITPFGRWDSEDQDRSHLDMRELSWLYIADAWELRIGLSKVFWGVNESQHLVDVVNQTDLVENPDGEDKLGQPMIHLTWLPNWGTIDVFLLPYFRERTFPGAEGRLRPGLIIDEDAARYQADAEEKHMDAALRWSWTYDIWDVGLSHFYGTQRDPRFVVEGTPQSGLVLIPVYDLMHQTGLDVQATLDAWLLKLEAIHRISRQDVFNALTVGFEYTLYGIFETAIDLGLIAEYLHDSRGREADTPFQDDTMLGLRFAFNDVRDSEILGGVIIDNDHSGEAYSLEAKTRLSDRWTIDVEARIFSNMDEQNGLYSFRRDDFVQLVLAYHF